MLVVLLQPGIDQTACLSNVGPDISVWNMQRNWLWRSTEPTWGTQHNTSILFIKLRYMNRIIKEATTELELQLSNMNRENDSV
jgi:hypothetical protein